MITEGESVPPKKYIPSQNTIHLSGKKKKNLQKHKDSGIMSCQSDTWNPICHKNLGLQHKDFLGSGVPNPRLNLSPVNQTSLHPWAT